jgi:putative transposase
VSTTGLRREFLGFFFPVGERHLRQTVKEYIHYFNLARPNQGIKQHIPCLPLSLPHSGKVVSAPVLGGLHHNYRRQAA